MKKITNNIIVLAILIASTALYSQSDNNLRVSNWKIGEDKIFYENKITRLEGENSRYGVTNLGYQSLSQLVEGINKKAEREMWNEEKKSSNIKLFQDQLKGGILYLFISRLTIDAANTKVFTVIIKDSNDKELNRQELKSKVPELPGDDRLWTNLKSVGIPMEIKEKFYVYIIDSLGMNGNVRFKFEVNP